MKLDYSEIIKKIQEIEKRFNSSSDPTERYALIELIDYIAEQEIPVDKYLKDMHRRAMLEAQGIDKRII